MQERVLLGMSGGIDSTATAIILKDEGYAVTGIHFQFFKDQKPPDQIKAIADRLNIELIVADLKKEFEETIIKTYTSEHLKGRTPSICTYCNPKMKWKYLLEYGDRHNCKWLATGHYIRFTQHAGRKYIQKGIDQNKDQSYYMWMMNQQYIDRMMTPLGDYTKDQVKEIARQNGFPDLKKAKESTGLCFAPDMNCQQIISHFAPEESVKTGKGKIVDRRGNEIGYHLGYLFYTIGQKKDLFLKNGKNLCVAEIDAKNNILVADTWESLWNNDFQIADYHLIDPDEAFESNQIEVKVRGFGLNPKGYAKLKNSGNSIRVITENPAWAPAPGQPAVFYIGDRLVGGGVIC